MRQKTYTYLLIDHRDARKKTYKHLDFELGWWLLLQDRDRNAIPSVFIGKPVPQIILPPVPTLRSQEGIQIPGFGPDDLQQGVFLVNIWGSWCVPCRQEHPALMHLSRDGRFQIFGINHRDKPDNAAQFLASLGNPYTAVGADPNGKGMIEWGGYGVPETFVVDAQGRIQLKFIGPIDRFALENEILPKVQELQAQQARQ